MINNMIRSEDDIFPSYRELYRMQQSRKSAVYVLYYLRQLSVAYGVKKCRVRHVKNVYGAKKRGMRQAKITYIGVPHDLQCPFLSTEIGSEMCDTSEMRTE